MPCVLLSCGLLALAGSASTAGGGTPQPRINEYDFGIQAPKAVHPGEVTFVVTNQGPDDHELLIARQPRGGRLPLRSDGLTVDEEALERQIPGALEPGKPGARRRLRVTLKPGRYVVFCNMSGHYLGGMHAVLIVG